MRMKMLLVITFVIQVFTIDMRKPLKRDKFKQSIRENGENYLVSPDQVSF